MGHGSPGGQITDRTVPAHGVNGAPIGIGDGNQPQFGQTAVMIEEDHVARVQRQTRWRQFQDGTFAPDPSLHQRAAAAALGFFRRYGQWDGLRGARGVHRDAAGFDLGCVIILVGARHLPFKAVCL